MSIFKFRLFGFPIDVQGGFLLFVGLVALQDLEAQAPIASIVSFVAVLTLSLLVHELGHAFAARSLRVPVMGIHLAFMHGAAMHQRTTHPKQLAISLAGPLAGFALAGVALLGMLGLGQAQLGAGGAAHVLEQVVYLNLVYGVFNLLPMLPLDGGNALRSAISWGTNARTGLRVVGFLGAALALALVVYAFSVGFLFLAALAGFLVWTNVQAIQASAR
ncbi:MAG: site-2 protease family protein [Myxococcota bacterium]